MLEDRESCLRAVAAKDPRFDGWFVAGVVSTGIYCRPSCPATPARADRIRVLPSAAAAQQAGFRACKRCRPDASPGSPEWDVRGDVVARAMRLVGDGLVDREGVPALARAVGYERRQLERLMRAELGAGPLALARAQRAQNARLLIETTALPLADVAFAAGFGSVRQFNDTVREVFASTPGELRRRGSGQALPAPGTLTLRLPFRRPLLPDNLLGHLAATAVPGVEEWRDGAYRRTLRLPHGAGVVALTPADGHVVCRLGLDDLRDLAAAVARCRRLLDLDADPEAVDAALAEDPALAPLVATAPGRRVPRTVDEAELALRVVLGQQVSTAAARTHAARIVRVAGTPVADPHGGLTHLFPEPAAVAALDPGVLALPAARRAAVLRLARALADGEVVLGPGVERARARAQLAALPGIGPWTVEVVAMRGLGDPDAWPAGDLGLRAGLAALGDVDPRRWSPWRSYAVQHVWALLPHPVNRLPEGAAA